MAAAQAAEEALENLSADRDESAEQLATSLKAAASYPTLQASYKAFQQANRLKQAIFDQDDEEVAILMLLS